MQISDCIEYQVRLAFVAASVQLKGLHDPEENARQVPSYAILERHVVKIAA